MDEQKYLQKKLKENAFDFGFSAVDEAEVSKPVEDHWKQKTLDLRDMIIPLLQNLKRDPDKEYIRWPNRVEKIDEFIKKINSHCEVKENE